MRRCIIADQNPEDMRAEAQDKRNEAAELISSADAIETAADELEQELADADNAVE